MSSVQIDSGSPIATEADRSVLATRHLCDTLGLGILKPKELKHLGTALAEAATQEVGSHPEFAARILALYRELTEKPKPATGGSGSGGRQPKAKPKKAKLTPIRPVDPELFGPDRPLDPYLLHHVYGDEQWQLALDDYPAPALKQAAGLVEQRNPGTLPKGRLTKPALMDYIVRYVAR